ncbi:MAG: 23S rRNA (pseudouridine(1915)-N(3))-methyltransferase RlmH [Patescibacteria group bacterium]|nr:23S rRNA (pseudouridine(1915)-N(3))-methyltransferase RlmH [Patescibacteria group bacterium]
MNISIIAVGKLKEAHWKGAVSEYVKRLSSFCKVKIIEVPETSFKTAAQKTYVLKTENERITRAIPPHSFVIALDQRGVTLNSEEFASKLETWSQFGTPITFVIGGPLGLDDTVKERANIRLSFSEITFPHQLARVILLEQVYRAITIQKGMKYHY